MAQPIRDATDARLRASLLTYFRRSSPTSHLSRTPDSPLLPRSPEAEDADLETAHGDEEAQLISPFANSLSSNANDPHHNQKGTCNIPTLLHFLLYILLLLLLLLNLDALTARNSAWTGILPSSISLFRAHPSAERKLRFCLVTPDREAPGPRVWQFLPEGVGRECRTQVVEMRAVGSEGWGFFAEDTVIVGDQGLMGGDIGAKGEFGDDFAEEGKLDPWRLRAG